MDLGAEGQILRTAAGYGSLKTKGISPRHHIHAFFMNCHHRWDQLRQVNWSLLWLMASLKEKIGGFLHTALWARLWIFVHRGSSREQEQCLGLLIPKASPALPFHTSLMSRFHRWVQEVQLFWRLLYFTTPLKDELGGFL